MVFVSEKRAEIYTSVNIYHRFMVSCRNWGSFPGDLMKDGTFVGRRGPPGRRITHRTGTSGRNMEQTVSNSNFLRMWCASSRLPLPLEFRERSYLINRAPSPVFIYLQKLVFHGWQASCHPSCHSFFSVPEHGQPQLATDRKNCAIPRFSVAGGPITVTPLTACSWRKHAAGSTYTVRLSSGG